MGGKGGGGTTVVQNDPRIGQAALEQSAIGRELAQLGRDEFTYQKERTDRMDPIYEKLMNTAIEESETNQERAADQWQQYKDVFQPIENQMADEAMNYDSPEETARREGLAAATVARQFDASDAQMSREMARTGVSPTSSLGVQGMRDQANARALARAGAVNKERGDTKLLGMSLRENAAKFGRNQTGTGLAASAAALQGGQSAAGILGAQQQSGLVAGQQAGSLMGAGAGQIGSAGSLLQSNLNSMINQQMSINQMANQNAMAGQAGLGSLLGTGMMAGAMAFSSEKLKEDITPADDDQALGELEQVAVKDWKYKDGVEDGGQHTGPIAEDMQAAMGDEVAPGGVGLDLISVSGKHHSAIRALAKRGKKLEKRIDRLERAAAGLADVEDVEFREKPSSLPDPLKGDISAGIVGLETVINKGD